MIFALFGVSPRIDLVECHIYRGCVQGVHHWDWCNGFMDSILISVVPDPQ